MHMSSYNVRRPVGRPVGRAAASATRGALLLLVAALLIACGSGLNGPDASDGSLSEDGDIRASPNPVPGGEGTATTRISWTTKGDLGTVRVYVSENGQTEALFGEGPEYSVDAPWIVAGSTYEFRLYAEKGSERRLIDKVTVTRGGS